MLTADQKQAKQVYQAVEDKYASKKEILVMGYERARTEEEVHYKQKDYRKYDRMFQTYAYPINEIKFDSEAIDQVKAAIEDETSMKL